MKKFISVCLCICIFAAQLSGCSDIGLPLSDGPSDAEKLEKIRTSGEYPEILVETAEKCPQTLDYVYNYPELKDRRFDIDLSADAQSGTVPLFIQWDERWGYEARRIMSFFVRNPAAGTILFYKCHVLLRSI